MLASPVSKEVRALFYKGTKGAIVIYDISNRATFENVPYWVAELVKHAGKVPLILVGNKIDLRGRVEGCITSEEGEELARLLSEYMGFEVPFRETCALTGEGVQDVFLDIACLIIKSMLQGKPPHGKGT